MTRKHSFNCILLAAGLFAAAGFAGADTIYKHVDENGKVTYSSSPPKGGGKVQKLDVPDKPSAAEVAAARRQLEDEKRQLEGYHAERRKESGDQAKLQDRPAQSAERPPGQVVPDAVAADDPPVYYPGWGYRPPLRPVNPWPQPDTRPSTPLPANPSPPLMAPPIRPGPEPK
jgi:hypothetical protein